MRKNGQLVHRTRPVKSFLRRHRQLEKLPRRRWQSSSVKRSNPIRRFRRLSILGRLPQMSRSRCRHSPRPSCSSSTLVSEAPGHLRASQTASSLTSESAGLKTYPTPANPRHPGRVLKFKQTLLTKTPNLFAAPSLKTPNPFFFCLPPI